MIRTVEVARIQQRARIVTTGGLVAALLALPLPLPGDAQAISAPAIASQAVVGAPSLAAAATVAPAMIVGDALVHVPAIAAGTAAIGAPAIAPASFVASPIVAAVPGQAIVPPAIVSGGVVPSPGVTGQGVATIAPALLASGSVIRAPAIGAGGVSLAPASLVSTAIVRAPMVITNPAPFAFDQDTNVDPGIGKASNEITLDMGGSMVPVTVTVSGAPDSYMLKNGADIGAQPTTGVHGDRFRVIHTSSTSYSTTKASTLTAGTTKATYTTTTKAEAVASLDSDTQTLLSAMTVQPTATRAKLYDDLIVGLKADGLWAKIDWLTIMAAHDEQAARINVRSPPRSLTAVNSPTFKPDLGFAGGGSAYLHTGEIWTGTFTRMQRNSGTLFVRMTEEATTSDMVVIGNMSDWSNTISVRSNNGNEQFRVCGGGTAANPSNSKLGTRIASRTSANLVTYYVDGLPNGTSTTSSSAPGSSNGTILRVNSSYSTGTIGVAGSASGLSDAEAMALHRRIQAFFTAIGVA